MIIATNTIKQGAIIEKDWKPSLNRVVIGSLSKEIMFEEKDIVMKKTTYDQGRVFLTESIPNTKAERQEEVWSVPEIKINQGSKFKVSTKEAENQKGQRSRDELVVWGIVGHGKQFRFRFYSRCTVQPLESL